MNIIFKQLRITDIVNKISKTINFNDGDNLITSKKNSTGKSVLLKSLYHTLGADSAFDDKFNTSNVLFDLTLEFNKLVYRFLRYKDNFAVIKSDKLIDFVPFGDRSKLSLLFEKEFDIRVYLKNRDKNTELAPPAYLFIPYYLDQDRSWKEEQEPFSKKSMGQYTPLSKNELYLYHLGLYKNDYGKLKTIIDELNSQILKIEKDLEKLDYSYNQVKKTLDNEKIITNTEELESLYRYGSSEISKLIEKQNDILNNIFLLDSKRLNLLITIKKNNVLISKLKKNNHSNSVVVQCPNCNEEFDIELKDDIVNIYSSIILEKENESLLLEISNYEGKIKEFKNDLSVLTEEINKFQKKLNDARSDYEKYVTRISLSSLLDKQLKEINIINNELITLKKIKSEKDEELKKIKEKTSIAKESFCDTYSFYLDYLSVEHNVNDLRAFNKIKLSGSQYVRSTLAFYFAFLKTKEKYNPNKFCFPLVIDSPREGEQDNENSIDILKLVLEEKVNNKQRIVASVNVFDYIDIKDLSDVNIIDLGEISQYVMNSSEFEIHKQDIAISLAYFKDRL